VGVGEAGRGAILSGGQGAGTLEIRSLKELEEFQGCVELEEAVWGYDPADMVPRRLFLLASRIGGQVLGAYVGETMVGFAMALPGYREGRPYLHSHMLGVLAEYRNRGIGKALKLAQREDALARGIELMEWTFDPLQIKNAHLNIAGLGAIARRYARDFYGPSSSPLQGGLPTDRLYAEWWLRSERVTRTLAGMPQRIKVAERVNVPASVAAWKASAENRGEALAVQARNADALAVAFARGLAVVGYERSAAGDGVFLLGELEEGEDKQHED